MRILANYVLWFLILSIVPAGAQKTSDQVPGATTLPSSLTEASVEKTDMSEEGDISEGEELVDAPETMDVPTTVFGERPWTPPNYSGQDTSLGYSPDIFKVQPSMVRRVDFWKSIYTQYTTEQGVIHDTESLAVYEKLDFGFIASDKSLGDRQKSKSKKRFVKEKKTYYIDILKKLARLKSAENLSGDELRIWKLFENDTDSNKFTNAATKKRVRFQLGQADRFKQGIYYSGRYLPKMEAIFREAGLPVEITRLPFVESSFNIFARSKVGASGIWQFMRSTGRLYKMKNTGIVDERNDPIRATYAAVQQMRDNYKYLENWPLAMTAYNHGAAGIRKLVRQVGSTDLQDLIDRGHRRRFGFASENFYACFLAALDVERHAGDYFKEAKWSEELKFEDVELPKAISVQTLLPYFKNDPDRLDSFNPQFSPRVRKGRMALPRGLKIRLPLGTAKQFLATAEKLSEPNVSHVAVKKFSGEGSSEDYKMESGDTLGAIARKFGVSIQALMDANNIDDVRRIRAGQVLHIP